MFAAFARDKRSTAFTKVCLPWQDELAIFRRVQFRKGSRASTTSGRPPWATGTGGECCPCSGADTNGSFQSGIASPLLRSVRWTGVNVDNSSRSTRKRSCLACFCHHVHDAPWPSNTGSAALRLAFVTVGNGTQKFAASNLSAVVGDWSTGSVGARKIFENWCWTLSYIWLYYNYIIPKQVWWTMVGTRILVMLQILFSEKREIYAWNFKYIIRGTRREICFALNTQRGHQEFV